MKNKRKHEAEKNCSCAEFITRLRRIADCLEQGRSFDLKVSGERIRVPAQVRCTIEYEREGTGREVELQIKWTRR